MQDLSSWTKDDFLSFLSLCGAQADMTISETEIDWIIKYFGENSYQKANALHAQQSDYENIQLLLALKKRFYPGDDSAEEIIGNLRALFSADGTYARMEQQFERALKHLL
ncbi:MAG: hypothetical protein AAGD05_02775 [Bacteroidota bacterium]